MSGTGQKVQCGGWWWWWVVLNPIIVLSLAKAEQLSEEKDER